MSRKDTRTPEQREMDEIRERVEAEAARLDETLTRRDVVDAIVEVASAYGGNGNHECDLIAAAFRKLAKALS